MATKAQKLRKQLEHAQTEILRVSERFHSALQERTESVAETAGLRSRLQDLAVEMQAVADQRDLGQVELGRLTISAGAAEVTALANIHCLKEELGRAENERDTNSAQVKTLRSQLRSAKDIEENLRTTVSGVVAELERIKVECDALQRAKHQLQEESLASRRENDTLRSQILDRTVLVTERDGLRHQVEQLTDSRDSLEDARYALREEWRSVCDKNDVLMDRLRDVETDRDTLKATVAELLRENSLLSERAGLALSQVEQLRGQVGHLQNSVEFWKVKSQSEHKKQETFQAELTALTAEHDTLRGTLLENQRMASSLKHESVERERIAQARDAMSREKDAVVAERDALASERDALAASLDALVLTRDKLQTELETVLRRGEDYKREASEFESRNKALDHKTKQVECERLKVELKYVNERRLQERRSDATKPSTNELETLIAGLRRQNRERLDRIKALELHREMYRDEMQGLKHVNKRLYDDGKTCMDELLSKLRSEREEHQSKLRSEREDHQSTRQYVSTLKGSLMSYRAEKDALMAKVVELKEHLREEQKRTGVQCEVQEVLNENQRLCAEIDRLEKEKEQIAADLAAEQRTSRVDSRSATATC